MMYNRVVATHKTKLLYIDTETAGLDPTHALLQVALIVEIDGEVKQEIDIRLRPDPTDKIDPKALEVNHLTQEEIQDPNRLTTLEAYRKIKSVFLTYIDKYDKQDKFYLVGQNVHFDYGFLLRLWEKMGDKYLGSFISYHKIDLIAVTALYRMAGVLPNDDRLPSMKLEALCNYFNLQAQKHEALADIRQTREIFHRYIQHAKQLPMIGPVAGTTEHQTMPEKTD